MTEVQVATRHQDAVVGDAAEFAKGSLNPEGHWRFTLIGVYGLKENNNGKPYISVRFALDQQAIYDENGDLTETVDIERPKKIFHEFWIGSAGGNRHLASWLEATVGLPKGEFNPETNKYEFDKIEALQQSIDMSAWNEITHVEDPNYGWQDNTGFEFRRNPRNRIKPKNGEG